MSTGLEKRRGFVLARCRPVQLGRIFRESTLPFMLSDTTDHNSAALFFPLASAFLAFGLRIGLTSLCALTGGA
jgi:hypothetical protein